MEVSELCEALWVNHSVAKDYSCNFIDSNLNPNANIFHVNEYAKSHGHVSSISTNGDFNNSNLTSTLDLVGKETPDAHNCNDNSILKSIHLTNADRLIIAQLNINSIRNKFDALKTIFSGIIDILGITESKLDNTNQFPLPFCLDRDSYGGGVMIFVRDDIPCRVLKSHSIPQNLEGIVLEINLRKVKWLSFGGYNPH